jgi:hypothetical protein
VCVQRSALEQDVIHIDSDTQDMLKSINFESLAGVEVQTSGARK